MAQSAIDKIPPSPELDALTAQKAFGWKKIHKHDGALVGKKQDKAGRWRLAKVPYYSTNPVHAYPIEKRMKQLGRLDQYLRELFRITRTKNIPSQWPPRINVAGQLSKLWDGTGKSFLYANREENNEYRDSAPRTSVLCSNQLWNFAGVVFGLYAGTRLDVSVSRQMVSCFRGAV
jgi:hypothetical protein